MEGRLSRRSFITMIGVGLGALGYIGLEQVGQLLSPKKSEIERLYPEIANLHPTEQKVLKLDRSEVKVIKAVPIGFDVYKNIAHYYNVYDAVAQQKRNFIQIWEGRELTLTILPRGRGESVVFVVPDVAPAPKWNQITGRDANDNYGIGFLPAAGNREDALGFARVHSAAGENKDQLSELGVELEANIGLAIVACNHALKIKSEDQSSGLPLEEVQRVTCISYGAPLAMRQFGVTYRAYSLWADLTRISGISDINYAPVKFSEEVYNAIPLKPHSAQ